MLWSRGDGAGGPNIGRSVEVMMLCCWGAAMEARVGGGMGHLAKSKIEWPVLQVPRHEGYIT